MGVRRYLLYMYSFLHAAQIRVRRRIVEKVTLLCEKRGLFTFVSKWFQKGIVNTKYDAAKSKIFLLEVGRPPG